MGSDLMVALARATTDGLTLFGHNSNRPRDNDRPEAPSLVGAPGRDRTPGEQVRATHITLPEVRQTRTVLAGRSGTQWGYQHGVNEPGVAVGLTPIYTKLVQPTPGLTGPDLVRLALERAATACQAVEVLTDLIGRHGQGSAEGHESEPDVALLVADADEAFVLEAAGHHWALTHVNSVRAASDVCLLRQDWDRLAHGLSDLAIQRGWWPMDGCKLDFAGAVGRHGPGHAAAVRRWGKATMQLEQHSGQIDAMFLRRLMAQLSEALHPPGALASHETTASLIVQLPAGKPPVAWCAFGPPGGSVYFPLIVGGDVPAALGDEGGAGSRVWRTLCRLHADSRRDARLRAALRSALAELQQHLDAAVHEIVDEAARCQGEQRGRLIASFHQQASDRFEEIAAALGHHEEGARRPHFHADELAGTSISDF